MPKNYVVIENTPGYLPEDTEPAYFDSYAEALRHLVEYNKELRDSSFLGMDHYEVQPIINGQFSYFDKTKSHDLGRSVEIVSVEYE